MVQKALNVSGPVDAVVTLAGTVDPVDEMVLCRAQEFISMGRNERKVADIFRQPFYRDLYWTYATRGDDYVRDVVHRAMEQHNGRLARLFGHPVC